MYLGRACGCAVGNLGAAGGPAGAARVAVCQLRLLAGGAPAPHKLHIVESNSNTHAARRADHCARRALQRAADRREVVCAMAAGSDALCRGTGFREAEILCPGNAALSFGRTAHGTRAQLFDRRCACPLHVDERVQRLASHGMGFVRAACGECGDFGQRAATRMDAAQHCQYEGADEATRVRIRLVARSHHVPAGLLQVEPVVFFEALRARIGVSQEKQSQLVSEVRHRAGE